MKKKWQFQKESHVGNLILSIGMMSRKEREAKKNQEAETEQQLEFHLFWWKRTNTQLNSN